MAAEPEAEINLEGESAFMQLLGLSFEEMSPERVVAFFETGPEHHQPWGLVHGGVFTAAIETAATTGAYYAVKDKGQLPVSVNNVTDFLRPYHLAGGRGARRGWQDRRSWPGSTPKRRGGDLRVLPFAGSITAQTSSRVSSPR